MAGIVETVFDGTYWKNWLRNAAGGAYNTAAGLTALPVQAASVVGQLASGKPWADVQVPDPLREGRQAFSEMTGLPTEKAEKGFKTAFGFGRGAVPGPTAVAAAAGGAINAVAETVTDNPIYQAAINVGAPLAAIGGARGIQAIRSGSLMDAGSNVDTTIPMSKGRATGKAGTMSIENMLERHPKTADAVAAKKRVFTTEVENKLRSFLDKAVNSKDGDAGLKAAIAWKRFEEGQVAKHKSIADKEFSKAYALGNKKGVVDVTPVKAELEQLYEKYASGLMGDEGQKIAKDLQGRIKQLSSVKKVSLEEVQSQLDYLNDISKGAGQFPDISPGVSAGVARKMKQGWENALKAAAAGVDKSGNQTKEALAASTLLNARRAYADRAEDLKKVSDSALGVFFDTGKTGERIMLQPEKVMEKLRKLPPSERDFFVAIMDMTDSSVTDALRKNILEDMIQGATVKGASARAPSFSPTAFLKELENRKKDIAFLIPDETARKEFYHVERDIRRSIQSTYIDKNTGAAVVEEAGGLASIASGKAGANAITRGIIRGALDAVSDKEAMFNMLYGASSQPKTMAGRVYGTFKEASKQTPFIINRELQGMVEAGRPTKPGEEQPKEDTFIPPPPEGFWDDEEVTSQVTEDDPMAKLLDIVATVESNRNPAAVSPKGAVGEYQFMPETAKQYGIDPRDSNQARDGAKRMFSYLLKKYDGDVNKALAAYNWGEGNVDRQGLENMPTETRNYIDKINGMITQ